MQHVYFLLTSSSFSEVDISTQIVLFISQSVYICRCVPIRSWLCVSYAVLCVCFRVYFSLLCVFMRLWEGGTRPCEPPPTEGKVEQWSTREWEGAWVISAPAAHAQRWGRIKVCECIRACLPGCILFNYFIPPLVSSGASFRVGSPICICSRPHACAASACVSAGRPLDRGLLPPQGFAQCPGMILRTCPFKPRRSSSRSSSLDIPSPPENMRFPHVTVLFWGDSSRLINSFSLLFSFALFYHLPARSTSFLLGIVLRRLCFWSSFNPPCTVPLVHTLSVCG